MYNRLKPYSNIDGKYSVSSGQFVRCKELLRNVQKAAFEEEQCARENGQVWDNLASVEKACRDFNLTHINLFLRESIVVNSHGYYFLCFFIISFQILFSCERAIKSYSFSLNLFLRLLNNPS